MGNLIDQGTFDQGKKTGEWISYNADGLPSVPRPASDVVVAVVRRPV